MIVHRWVKKCWISLGVLMFVAALLMSVVRILAPTAHRYKAQLESHLSILMGEPVTIKRMHASWYWFEPVLKLDHVVVSHDGEKVLSFKELLVGINILSSLWHWQIQPGILFIDKVHLKIHQDNNHWRVEGFSGADYTTHLTSRSYLPLLGWLLSQQKIVVKNVTATLYLQDGLVMPVRQIALMAVNKHGHYRLKAHAALGLDDATDFSLLGELDLASDMFRGAKGSVFFSSKNIHMGQISNLLPQQPYEILKGNGELNVWLDLNDNRVKQLQSEVHVSDAVWRRRTSKKTHTVNKFDANLAFTPLNKGWKLTANQIELETPKGVWPQNEAMVSYDKPSQTVQVFIKTLSLLSLDTLGIEWPVAFEKIFKMNPSGQLTDSQIGVTAGEVSSFLSRFSALSFEGNGVVPQVKNLSGAFYWEPTQGRLELDGQNTALTFSGHSPLQFDEVNLALDWKTLSEGLRLNLDRFVVSHRHLLLSARGLLDGVSNESLGSLQLSGEFSTEGAEYWIPLLPLHGHVKPKLEAWLKNDIKQIQNATGKFKVDGPLADFPFDKKPGEFSILTTLQGVDLAFSQDWPVAHDIDAYLRVNKRDLSADISHADLGGVVSDKISLRVDGLGLGQETLTVHGNVEAPADKMLEYVLNSPLKKHLDKLNALKIGEEAALDLGLEVALYPESDDVLVRGMLLFNDNTLTVHHTFSDFVLNHLLGIVYFDEHGVSDSLLTASFLDEPMAVRVRTIKAKESYTLIELKTKLSAAILRHHYNIPILSWMEGPIALVAAIQLTDNPSVADHFDLNAGLNDVKVNLPEPFGKLVDEPANFSLIADVNLKKNIQVKLNYAEKLKADLTYLPNEKSFKLMSGSACIGCTTLPQKNSKEGASLVVTLPRVDWSAWRRSLALLPASSTSSVMPLDGFKTVNIDIGALDIMGKHYDAMKIRADAMSTGKWAFKIAQDQLIADLVYDHPTYTISGKVSHFVFDKPDNASKPVIESPHHFNPKDIPSFDITFNDFIFNSKPLGQGSFKSSASKNGWHVDTFHLESDAYVFDAQGDWNVNSGLNESSTDAKLQIKKLSSMLLLWNISPVVEAKQGDIQFKGKWPGSPEDFSLKRLNGDMAISFKKGRVTHLSKETEKTLAFGKLLSILSLQTIPRRLQLDFSDLSKDGYSFDLFKGNFVINNGVMKTDDSYIDGPVAYATMKGDLDLDKKLYNLDLNVSPHITASLPIVVAIAGGPIAGPIAGIATWVASKIINKGVEKISGYTYKISGPWLEPVVQQVHIFKKQEPEAKTDAT